MIIIIIIRACLFLLSLGIIEEDFIDVEYKCVHLFSDNGIN